MSAPADVEELAHLRIMLASANDECAATKKECDELAAQNGRYRMSVSITDANTRTMMKELHSLREQATYYAGWEERMEELTADLDLCRARALGVPSPGIVQFDSEQTAELRERIASLESENAGLRERVTVLESQWQLEQRLKLDAYADGNALRERVTRLEGTLRSEIVDYSVNVKHTGEHYSLCGICEARGPEEEEPPHKSDCVLFSAALSDAPPAATVKEGNQCDGCRAGRPMDSNGNHSMNDGSDGSYMDLMRCQRYRYESGNGPQVDEGTADSSFVCIAPPASKAKP